ncbi:tRNA pseudouridine synthase [Wolfiporia cocos MD-104 SS10]|uniref:tRNA pseudouridine synthase n=1 Tax=Wolfiporia cocos (strain MD-104) TaxID=742152 RepID=A0A2H3JLC7_WOLCO|nr:tRNA pseudouridine synthase [Wolfiporia cocos MD-104 SS10]
MSPSPLAYESWSRQDLIDRLRQLDIDRPSRSKRPGPPPQHQQKAFNFSAHPRRKIALKFSYNGSQYSGLEFQKAETALPTVEGVLYDALAHTRLIDSAAGFEGCGWEKCGRTDRGVSAAGQVVSMWVRSATGEVETRAEQLQETTSETEADNKNTEELQDTDSGPGIEGDFGLMGDWDEPPTNAALPPPSKPTTEIRYISLLNNVLPPTIRIIAWSPVASDFSARFSCRYRHYKYFFNPVGLDLAAMQDAASRLVGENDFRNLCKLDPSKQLTIFTRRILSANINPAGTDGNLYVFDLVGTAFLYNQVRHIMAILFLVGTRLEPPSIVDALLNVDPKHPRPPFKDGEPQPAIVQSKPEYQMADPLPLMLWQCGYDADALAWRTDAAPEEGEEDADATISHRDLSNNLYHHVQSLCEQSSIHTALDVHFLRAVEKHHQPPPQYFPIGAPDAQPIPPRSVLSIPLGAGTYRRGANYVSLLKRPRGSAVELVNERWRVGKGARQMERRALAAREGGDE